MFEMKLTDIGEGITEGTVDTVFVKVGDSVLADQPVLSVQTDKVTADLPSPVAGKVVNIPVAEGDVVQTGATIIVIEDHSKKTTPSPSPTQNAEKGFSSPTPSRLFRMRNVKAAPYTRKLARSYGIEIETIEGTGKNKRITNEDIERIRQSSDNPTTDRTLLDTHTKKETLPFKGRRKQIAKKMTTSAYTIPHVTHFDRIDVSALIEVKDELKEDGVHLSLTAFFLKAVSIA
ncbi:dihydrolipoamide acyltransferase component of branched-chain alpha-keto acid dehydrogenase complex [Geomicrobium sp. JCM 19037]|nr:biotin/lipoyl-containing protein [Geomicrobium sp. JCM 19037]GAK03156.1 dihydrolipoamide acyltransferase component of branched-chain alpha-keto acid dehydrogenase complex [Geomicrobium sp. JCM 19037]